VSWFKIVSPSIDLAISTIFCIATHLISRIFEDECWQSRLWFPPEHIDQCNSCLVSTEYPCRQSDHIYWLRWVLDYSTQKLYFEHSHRQTVSWSNRKLLYPLWNYSSIRSILISAPISKQLSFLLELELIDFHHWNYWAPRSFSVNSKIPPNKINPFVDKNVLKA